MRVLFFAGAETLCNVLGELAGSGALPAGCGTRVCERQWEMREVPCEVSCLGPELLVRPRGDHVGDPGRARVTCRLDGLKDVYAQLVDGLHVFIIIGRGEWRS